MAEYGMIIRNNFNSMLINNTFRNYSYQGSGTASVVDTEASGETSVNISDTQNAIIAAFRPTSTLTKLVGFTESGSYYTHIKFIGSASTSIPYIYYTESFKNSLPSHGIAIYSSTSQPIFSSGEDGYFKIVGIYPYDPLNSSGSIDGGTCSFLGSSRFVPSSTKTITVNDVDNNYFLFIGWQQHTAICGTAGEGWKYTTGLKRINSTSIQIAWFHHETTTGVPSGTNGIGSLSGSGNLFIIEIEPPPNI